MSIQDLDFKGLFGNLNDTDEEKNEQNGTVEEIKDETVDFANNLSRFEDETAKDDVEHVENENTPETPLNEQIQTPVDECEDKAETEETKDAISNIKSAIKYRDELIAMYEGEIDKMKAEMKTMASESAKEKEELTSQLQDKELQLNEFFVETQRLQEKIQKSEIIETQMSDEIDKLKSEKEEIGKKVSEVDGLVASLNAKVKNMTDELETNEENHKLLKAKYEAVNEMLRSEEVAHNKSKATVEFLRKEVTELYDKLIELGCKE